MEESQKLEMQISTIKNEVTNFSSRESLWNFYFTTFVFTKGELIAEAADLADSMLRQYDKRFGEQQDEQ